MNQFLRQFCEGNNVYFPLQNLCVIVFRILLTIIDIATTFAPVLKAGQISVQTENIKNLLYDKFILELGKYSPTKLKKKLD